MAANGGLLESRNCPTMPCTRSHHTAIPFSSILRKVSRSAPALKVPAESAGQHDHPHIVVLLEGAEGPADLANHGPVKAFTEGRLNSSHPTWLVAVART